MAQRKGCGMRRAKHDATLNPQDIRRRHAQPYAQQQQPELRYATNQRGLETTPIMQTISARAVSLLAVVVAALNAGARVSRPRRRRCR